MATRYRAAFTLVELLVVIAIIAHADGPLAAGCPQRPQQGPYPRLANNEEQLGKAVITYEMETRHFPGYANNVSGGTVTWAALMLPYVGRNDLWEGTNGTRPAQRQPGSAVLSGREPVCLPLRLPSGRLSLIVCCQRRARAISFFWATATRANGHAAAVAAGRPRLPRTGISNADGFVPQLHVDGSTRYVRQLRERQQISMTDVRVVLARPMIAEAPDTVFVCDGVQATVRNWTSGWVYPPRPLDAPGFRHVRRDSLASSSGHITGPVRPLRNGAAIRSSGGLHRRTVLLQ